MLREDEGVVGEVGVGVWREKKQTHEQARPIEGRRRRPSFPSRLIAHFSFRVRFKSAYFFTVIRPPLSAWRVSRTYAFRRKYIIEPLSASRLLAIFMISSVQSCHAQRPIEKQQQQQQNDTQSISPKATSSVANFFVRDKLQSPSVPIYQRISC